MNELTTRPADRSRDGSKFRGVLIAIAVVLIGTWAFILFRPRRTIENDARYILQCILEGNSSGLYEHLYDHERHQLGLDRRDVDILLNQFIRPRWKGFSPTGPIRSEKNDNESQGTAWVKMANGKGQEFELSVTPFESGEGGQIALTNYLAVAWRCQYVISEGIPHTLGTGMWARLKGLEADRDRLEAAGISGTVSHFPGKPIVTWDTYRKRAREQAEKATSELNQLGLKIPSQ